MSLANPLLVVAPADGTGGVGDYSSWLIDELAARGPVDTLRTAGPFGDSLVEVITLCRDVRRWAKARPGGGVHFELSAGCVGPFWALACLPRGMRATATVHDPPRGAWWPWGFRGPFGKFFLRHLIHYPLRRLIAKLEYRILAKARIAVMSPAAATVMRQQEVNCFVIPHAVRRDDCALEFRPTDTGQLAVGLFGHVYPGKGFELLGAIRTLLPDDIPIRVAGRGTQDLPPVANVEYLCPISGKDEVAFWESLGVVLLPYRKVGPYGEMLSSSGVLAKAFQFRVPAVVLVNRAFEVEASLGAVCMVDNVGLAVRACTEIMKDHDLRSAMVQSINALSRDRCPERILERYEALLAG